MADLVERGRDAYTRWNNPPSPGLPDDAGVVLEMADRIASLEAEAAKHDRALLTVQNAAKTIASAHKTELEHLRQNHAFDQKLRAEHESLIERDAMMTDALLKAEARIAALEAEASEGERRGLERAAKVAGQFHGQAARAIRSLIPEAPVREAE